MTELTVLQWRKCAVLIEQWKIESRRRDKDYEYRMYQENIEFIKAHGHNPPFPERKDSEEIRVFKRGRKRHFGITPRMLGCWTVELGMASLKISPKARQWLRRNNLAFRGPVVANHSGKPEYEEAMKLFDWFLKAGFADESFAVSTRAQETSKRILRDLNLDYHKTLDLDSLEAILNPDILELPHSQCV